MITCKFDWTKFDEIKLILTFNETITTSLAASLYMVKGHYVCK